MGLQKYHAKRKFDKTPEPFDFAQGKPSDSADKPKKDGHSNSKNKLAFVVQKHHASSLHYDFRLELDGVLKSWAVPKGPSMNPHDRHLAIHVEDHPYEYRKFEGIIPKGSYGAGKVIIWDEGTYEPRVSSDDPEKELHRGLKKGHLTFILRGKKLHGEFALIKMHGAEENAWLLIKKGDEAATETDITKKDRSIKSGQKVDEVGEAEIPDTSKYPKVAKPWKVRPMLATLIDKPFNKDGWLFEIKWDGYRAVGSKHKSEVALYSRTDQDFADAYAPVVEALRQLKKDVILDGEIVVVDEAGRPHFEALQNWHRDPSGELHYYVFDILWYQGRDLRSMPLVERKQLLKSVIPGGSVIRYSDHIEGGGTKLFEEMRGQGLEGVIAKRADSPYRENIRGRDWLKAKTHLRQEVVIGGFTEPRGGRKYLGSLLLGVYDKEKFVYVGHSGGGIPDRQRKELREQLDKLEVKTSPFIVEPKPNAPVHWVKPEIVAEMNFSEWTRDGRMRHPQFKGLRSDKDPKQVKHEKPKNSAKPSKEDSMNKSPSTELKFTHQDKIFFPGRGYTKGDLIDYYRKVSDYILPYLKDRPHSLLRQPDGLRGEAFFQKNMEHLPEWVPSVDIYSESNKADLHWIVGGKLETLLYIVQLGSIEINPWNSQIKHLDKPDWAVIDLDPEGVSFKTVVEVAKTVKAVCNEWNVPSYPKTSGKTGIHIYIPMAAKYDYEQVKNFAHLIAMEVNKRQPKITSLERMPDKRKHKIYVDFLQNREGQTLAAPYSVRPTPNATISTPLRWDEVTSSLKPTDFTIKNIHRRLQKVGDLWRPVLGKGVDLAAILKKIEPLL